MAAAGGRDPCPSVLPAALALALALSGCAPPTQAAAAANPATPSAGCVAAVPPNPPEYPSRAHGGSAPQDRVAILEARVFAFAQAQLGHSLGSGQCADLADLALAASGAKSAADFAAATQGDDYVWGTPVDVRDARPGDVLQFKNFTYTTTVGTASGYRRDQFEAEHHTVIVARNEHGAMMVFQQNVDDDPSVRLTRFYVAPGTYNRLAGDPADTAAVTMVRTSGSVSAYRPQVR